MLSGQLVSFCLVMIKIRFPLALWNVGDLLLERGIDINRTLRIGQR